MFQLIWNAIAYSGMALVKDESEQKNVLLLNTLSILIPTFTVLFTGLSGLVFSLLFENVWTMPYWQLPLLFSFSLLPVLSLNGKGRRNLARFYFGTATLLFVGFQTWRMGPETNFHFYLIATALVQFFIFPATMRPWMYFMGGLAVLELVALHVFLPRESSFELVSAEVVTWMANTNLIVAASLICFLAAYATRVYEIAESYLHMERSKSEKLLLNILPGPIIEQLRERPETIAERFEECTILFSDLVGFTEMSHRLSAVEVVRLLNDIFSEFDDLAEAHGLEKIKTIGDAYMVVGGLPHPNADHAEGVARFALDMLRVVRNYRERNDIPLEIRIGMASGDAVAGVIGKKKFVYDLWGQSVNTASRMESSGLPGRVQVTESTYRLLKDKFSFEERGPVELKGMGTVNSYILLPEKAASVA
jgi:adenylate cyclase